MIEPMNEIKISSTHSAELRVGLISASHNTVILSKNLLRSDMCTKYTPVIQTGYNNISTAYNEATESPVLRQGLAACETSLNNTALSYYIYLHHDVFLPSSFEYLLTLWLEHLKDEDWGVLGVAGVKLLGRAKANIGYISDRGKAWGTALKKPKEVDTLDELMLITKGDYVFDEELDLHFYGADICMQAKAQGRKNYVIPAFVEHNSGYNGIRTDDYYRCKTYFAQKWKDYLPIATTTTIIEE